MLRSKPSVRSAGGELSSDSARGDGGRINVEPCDHCLRGKDDEIAGLNSRIEDLEQEVEDRQAFLDEKDAEILLLKTGGEEYVNEQRGDASGLSPSGGDAEQTLRVPEYSGGDQSVSNNSV